MTWFATDTRTSHVPVGEQLLAPEAFFSSRNTQLHPQTPWRPKVTLPKLSRASPCHHGNKESVAAQGATYEVWYVSYRILRRASGPRRMRLPETPTLLTPHLVVGRRRRAGGCSINPLPLLPSSLLSLSSSSSSFSRSRWFLFFVSQLCFLFVNVPRSPGPICGSAQIERSRVHTMFCTFAKE